MNFEVRLVLCILSCFRIAQLFALDDGPFYIFAKLRERIGVSASKDDCRTIRTNMADFINCPFCIGVWVSVLIILPLFVVTTVGDIVLLWLGVSGAQAFLQGIVDKKV